MVMHKKQGMVMYKEQVWWCIRNMVWWYIRSMMQLCPNDNYHCCRCHKRHLNNQKLKHSQVSKGIAHHFVPKRRS